ncbi:MAG: VanZ family protein [Ruminococcaceae bacterium]|nr:VanZ family protein [Oscillospiraceae bacterium]
MVKKVFLWICTIGWAMMIFWLSAQPATESAGMSLVLTEKILSLFPGFDGLGVAARREIVEVLHVVVRKLAHFGLYAMLGIWISLLCREYDFSLRRMFLHALLWGAMYAVSDECHQLFVAGRSGSVTDVLLDSFGVATGAFLVLCLPWYKKRKNDMQNWF